MKNLSALRQILAEILRNKGVDRSEIPLDESFLRDGIGLDSLDLAELSVRLEQRFGRDPFSEGVFPRCLRDVCAFYEKTGAPE